MTDNTQPPAPPAPVVDQVQQPPAPPADPYPLSKRATIDQVMLAGIRNGMSAEECEERLAKVMS